MSLVETGMAAFRRMEREVETVQCRRDQAAGRQSVVRVPGIHIYGPGGPVLPVIAHIRGRQYNRINVPVAQPVQSTWPTTRGSAVRIRPGTQVHARSSADQSVRVRT